jgi:hypothetical protein
MHEESTSIEAKKAILRLGLISQTHRTGFRPRVKEIANREWRVVSGKWSNGRVFTTHQSAIVLFSSSS